MTAILPLLWRFRWLLGGLAIAGLIWWQHHTIGALKAALADLRGAIVAEQRAREADVAGLTTLARGLASAAGARTKDQEALNHAIDTQHPAPASAGLATFLRCLSASDHGQQCAAAGARPASPGAASSAH